MSRRHLLLAAVVLLTGCVTEPWPTLPPTEYSGTVINEPLGKGEPGAVITAFRPKEKAGPADLVMDKFVPMTVELADTKIATTLSGVGGRFILSIPSGYATTITVESADDRLTAYLDRDMKRSTENMVIKIDPVVQEVSYGSVAISDSDLSLLRSACEKMMFQLASTRYRHPLSVDDYAHRGIITPEEYAGLQRVKPHLLGRNPDIVVNFPRDSLHFLSFTDPIELVPNPHAN